MKLLLVRNKNYDKFMKRSEVRNEFMQGPVDYEARQSSYISNICDRVLRSSAFLIRVDHIRNFQSMNLSITNTIMY